MSIIVIMMLIVINKKKIEKETPPPGKHRSAAKKSWKITDDSERECLHLDLDALQGVRGQPRHSSS